MLDAHVLYMILALLSLLYRSRLGACRAVFVIADLVIITGDITSQATWKEFELSREILDPLLTNNSMKAFVIPGNHDYYTHEAVKKQRFERFYGDWMHARNGDLPQLVLGNTAVIGVNACAPNYILSRGYYSANEVDVTALFSVSRAVSQYLPASVLSEPAR